MIKMVSIDSSTTASGISLFQNGILKSHQCIYSKKEKDNPKYYNMCFQIIEKLNEIVPDILVIETPVVVRNAQTQRELTMVYGAIFGWCITNKTEFHSMRPTEWRKYTNMPIPVLEKGNKMNRNKWKKWAIKTVQNLYPEESIDDDNEAESILLGIAYINWFNEHAKIS